MYCELHCHSYYSLLDGASAPEELLDRAAELGMPALAITDQDGLYGVVPFWREARKRGIHPVIGAEIALAHGTHLVLLAETQAGYANLSRLLAAGHLAGSKGVPLLKIEDVAQHAGGLLCLAGGREGAVGRALLAGQEELARRAAAKLVEIFGRERVWLELQRHWLPLDGRLEAGIVAVAEQLELGLVVTNDVHYATQRRHRLYDILCATRHNVPLAELGARRRSNNEFYLKGEKEMAALFPDRPEAMELTRELAERCQVSLDFAHSPDGSAAANRLPAFPARSDDFPYGIPPGETAFSTLYTLSQSALRSKYQPVTPQAVKQLGHELSVIQAAGLADYFLIVWDIVRFSRCEGIRCQGRGSAANSLVAYLLDITPVDPLRYNLLFERFLSDRTDTMPDIDIDFAADRRDEVMAYVYRLYGADHAAMVCNVVTYQWRSAVRDVARALGYPPESVDRIAKQLKHGPAADGDTETRRQGDKEDVGQDVGQACSLTPVVGGARRGGGRGGGAAETGASAPTTPGSADASPASTHVHGHHFRGYGGKSVRHVDFLADDSEPRRDPSRVPVVQPPRGAGGRGADRVKRTAPRPTRPRGAGLRSRGRESPRAGTRRGWVNPNRAATKRGIGVRAAPRGARGIGTRGG